MGTSIRLDVHRDYFQGGDRRRRSGVFGGLHGDVAGAFGLLLILCAFAPLQHYREMIDACLDPC